MRTPANYDWYCMADPGTSGSAFAVLFAAVDVYKPFLFFLDEVYEKTPETTITPFIGPLIIRKCLRLNPDLSKWKCYYDSAAPWFVSHFRAAQHQWLKEIFGVHDPDDPGLRFAPVEKKPGEKENGLDTLNSFFINNSIAISEKCGNTIWEYDNYCRDKHGRLPKKNDHNIDNGRYLCTMAGLVSSLTKQIPLSATKRSAKNTRDYHRGGRPTSKGKMNLKTCIMKKFEE